MAKQKKRRRKAKKPTQRIDWRAILINALVDLIVGVATALIANRLE